MGVGEDRISNLPEPVLLHILSFLRTKCVVSTSILSKRWRDLWFDISVLNLFGWRSACDHNWESNTLSFKNFMDNMLSLNDKNRPTIQKFCLEVEESFPESWISAWISTLMKRKVEEIYLVVDAGLFQLPLCLFTCKSLTVLELHMEGMLDLPLSISFPSLKILRLWNAEFFDDYLTQQFFSNCPILEELILSHCYWISMNAISISAPTLKLLDVTGPEYFESGIDNCVVKINAPNLQSLIYKEESAKDFVLCSFSSLVDADIEFREEIGYGARASNLLAGLSHVKHLKMSCEIFEALSFPSTGLSTFNNLIHLEVSSRSPCSIKRTFLDFLQITPNLESLLFVRGIENLSNDGGSWTLKSVPQCLLLHLKSVEFQRFEGNPIELNLVKLFLDSARVLERMTIVFRKNKVEKVMDELLIYPRVSTSCVINF